MSAEQFMDRGAALMREIRETQIPVIKEAATLVADALAAGGVLHYYDRGHCTGEILHRAGGLFAIHPLQPSVGVGGETPPGRSSPDVRRWAEDDAVVDFILDQAHVREGDVLLACSVSGGSPQVVSLALRARARGVKVVAITSPTYSRAIPPRHPSGKFLYQVADVVIDNCGEVGDAALTIPGLDAPAVPTSGLAFVIIAWSLLAQVMRHLTEQGAKPQVYKSVNLPEGPEFNARAREIFEEKGL
jgi:uncharacterized phosphosugar-binding protein